MSSTAQSNARASVPQAQPVVVWFSAVKNGNQEELKTAFSEAMRQRFDQEGWAKVLKTYQDGFKQAFGDYKLEDFTFEFAGGDDKGYVVVVHKGMKLPGVLVVKEKTGWRVNER
jgi:hypothetical protein